MLTKKMQSICIIFYLIKEIQTFNFTLSSFCHFFTIFKLNFEFLWHLHIIEHFFTFDFIPQSIAIHISSLKPNSFIKRSLFLFK